MPSTRIYTRSFAGGEIAPEMYGRIDDVKYQSGAAMLRNFVTKPQGPAYNRPGTAFVRETGNSGKKSRLIPFVFSTTQAVVIEIGVTTGTASFFRFHAQGGTLLAPAVGSLAAYKTPSTSVTFTGSTDTVNWSGHTLANGEQVFFTGANLPPEVALNRIFYVINQASGTFQISTTSGGPAFGFANSTGNCNGYFSYKQGDLVRAGTAPNERAYYFRNPQTSYVLGASYADPDTTAPIIANADWWPQPATGEYEIPTNYSTGTFYTEAELFDVHYAQSNDVLTLVHPNYRPMELRRYGSTDWRAIPIFFTNSLPTPTGLSITATPGGAIEIDLARRWDNTVTNSNDRVVFEFTSEHGFAKNDTVYVYDCLWNFINDKFFLVQENAQAGLPTQLTVKTYDGGADVNFNTTGDTLADWTCSGDATTELITTNANPHNLLEGCPVIFNNVGVNIPPPPLTNGTTYYVRNPTATTFRVSATPTGALINLTGTTSGFRISIGKTGKFQFSNPTIDTNNKYKVTAIGSDLVESAATAEVTAANNLYVAGAYNTVTWNKVDGAVRYNVYKEQTGLYGYIGQVEQPTDPLATTVSFKDDNIAPDMGITTPIYDNVLQLGSDCPAAVTYYEQRRCFGGTTSAPQTVWMTASGTESNLVYHIPTQDSDRISFQVAARESNTIRHLVPLQQLVLLTNSAEWRVTSVNGDALTPYTISVRPQSFIGANNVQPLIVNNTMIYCAARGGHVRELGYNWQANGYITGDLSLRAAHLFDEYTLTDMAYGKAPRPLLWFISSTGKLLGMTYVPEEQIGAWHQHDTDGAFESCAVIPEGDEDMLYVVVKRTVNSVTKRYVERLQSRDFAELADAWFVDCGFFVDAGVGSAVSSVTIPLDASGNSYLRSKTVTVFADGKVQTAKVVPANGVITLDAPARKVLVGLPITADLQTLPMTIQMEAFGQYRVKNVNKAFLRVLRSGQFYIGPTASKLLKSDPYTTSPTLVSENVDVMLSPSWEWDGTVFVRQTDPLPLEITSLTVETAIGGG